MIKKILKPPREFLDSLKTIGIAVFLALIFRSTIAAPYKIPTGSMIPTLKIGDFIFVSKLSYGLKIPFTNSNMLSFDPPKRGDVVVFIYPRDRSLDYIKRVVALPSDIVEIRDDILYINGDPMPLNALPDQSILKDVAAPNRNGRLYKENLASKEHFVLDLYPSPQNYGPITVPEEHVFVMGDNRDNSTDSRIWGFLPMKNIRGRALFVWLSLDSENWRIRWERFATKIH